MKTIPFLLTGALWLASGATARAQEALLVAAPELQTARIQTRNVQPSLLAYWLDSAHQPMPSKLKFGLQNGGLWTSGVDKLTRQPGNGNGPRGLKLPEGIISVTPVDPDNVLEAHGTATGLDALQKLVGEIDVPLNQVEIQAQLWEVEPTDIETLGLRFYQSITPGEKLTPPYAEAAFATTGDETSSALQGLAGQRRATLFTAPRVTAIDGLAALLVSTETRPIAVDGTPQKELVARLRANSPQNTAGQVIYKSEEKPDDNWDTGIVMVSGETGFRVAPVLRSDLVALAFQFTYNGTLAQASTILLDGQTLAMRLPDATTTGGRTLLVLITPRIVKRGQASRFPADGIPYVE